MNQRRPTTFTYPGRHRWAYVPTVLFLLVVIAILALDPALISEEMDEVTRRNALLLAGALAIGFAVAFGARWASPFSFELTDDALVAAPLVGAARRVHYGEVRDVKMLPKTFMRGVPEVVLQVEGGRPITIRTDLVGYQKFEKGLRRRLAPGVQARWKEERQA
ncbi:MAG TPA: hypothetical protein VFJ03_00155 [Candidatus Limnocylindria bacterium]|jgi:hypothetical protein|nr:hypothetical protein [Candidatus Limnocylindria bacterium]